MTSTSWPTRPTTGRPAVGHVERVRALGLRLCATDTDWTVGTGPEVAADALSMLLLLTGRGNAVAHALHGAGVAELPTFDRS
jgi:hypothetical protein